MRIKLPPQWGGLFLSAKYKATTTVTDLKNEVASVIRTHVKSTAKTDPNKPQPSNRPLPEELQNLQADGFELCLNASGQGKLAGSARVAKALQTDSAMIELLYLIEIVQDAIVVDVRPIPIQDAHTDLVARMQELCGEV